MFKRSALPLALVLSFSIYAAAQVDFGVTNPYERQELSRRGVLSNAQQQTVSGQVRAADGSLVKDARVEIHDLGSGNTIVAGYTNEGGSFSLGNVPRGNYELLVQAGLSEVRERISVEGSDTTISLRLPVQEGADVGSAHTVSVAQMRIPERARKLLRKAQDAAKSRKIDDANKYVADALKEYPKFAEALTLRGILHLDVQQTDSAREDLESAIATDPNYPFAYIALGATYNMLSRWDDAIRTLEHGIGLEATSWQGHFELGKSFIGKADYENSLRELSKAASMAPKYEVIHLVKAHALLGMKNYSDAMSEIGAYLERDPSGAQVAQAREMLGKVKAFVASNQH